jgi:hypothetical protein
MAMEYKKLYTENTEESEIHREFLFLNSNSLPGNKWGKEKHKFFGEFGSFLCNPCTKSEDQLSTYPQDQQDPNPRTIRNS